MTERSEPTPSKPALISRSLLGFFVVVFGLNKFLSFLPMPDPPEEGGAFLGALMNSGYVFPVLGVLYLVCGVLLLTGRAVGFALVVLAPLAINAALYHFRFDLAGAGGAVVFGLLIAVTAWFYRSRFRDLFA